MFEELVSDVKGEWLPKYGQNELSLKWTVNGQSCGSWISRDLIGALSLWLKEDHPPSPAEIAARLVERWDRNTDLADAQWGERLADLERHIAAVIAGERAREGT